MFIWLALLIPLFTAIILAIFFHHRTKWWEFGIPFVVSLLLVGGFKLIAESSATRDHEIWNGWVLSAHYYEDWNEYIHKICSRCVAHDKNGACTSTMYYDCSYVDYHPEYWEIKDSNGSEHAVNSKTYQYLVRFFGVAPQFVELNRHYHTNDGNMYQVLWPKTNETVEPVNVSYSYENRVQASRSVFSYQKISEEEAKQLGLFEYPEVSLFNYPSVLGDCGEGTKEANERLRFHNSMLGRSKQLRMWILCTDQADPAFGQLQESYWVGGNKNEVVLILGKGWSHIFSWTDNKAPLIEVRDFANQNRSPAQIADAMGEKLGADFVRKNFEDFSYLTIETPTWAIVITFLVTLLTNVGLSYFIVHNEWYEEWHPTQPNQEREALVPPIAPQPSARPPHPRRPHRKLRSRRPS